jgi:hypothetical protein
MLRIVVISSLFVAACDVGSIPGAGPDGGGGGGGDGSGSGSGNECVDAVTPAAAKHTHADGTGSKRGDACMAAGCHLTGNTGAGAPPFTFAGTVSTASDGNTPKPGATVKVIFASTTIASVADEDGNFYSTQTITLPAKTLATACPTIAPMASMIVAGGGNCNNCHTTGGTTTPIYVE